MAITYGFYNSMNRDRRYSAIDLSSIFSMLITDGVFSSWGDIFGTTPGTGLQVNVASGWAWFNNTWTKNDTLYPLTVSAPDVLLARYDTVVIEVNAEDSVRANTFKIVEGIPSSTPEKPALINTVSVHQHAIAHILVPAAATEITGSDIQVVVGTSECPFVTGILETVNVDVLFQKWETDFQTWFDNIKLELSDNVVTNLQRQIDERLKI